MSNTHAVAETFRRLENGNVNRERAQAVIVAGRVLVVPPTSASCAQLQRQPPGRRCDVDALFLIRLSWVPLQDEEPADADTCHGGQNALLMLMMNMIGSRSLRFVRRGPLGPARARGPRQAPVPARDVFGTVLRHIAQCKWTS